MTQGDDFLKKELDTAISATAQHVDKGVCPAHDAIRQGVNVLLQCKRSEMDGTPAISKTSVTIISSGVATALLAVLELLKNLAAK